MGTFILLFNEGDDGESLHGAGLVGLQLVELGQGHVVLIIADPTDLVGRGVEATGISVVENNY